MFLTPLMKCENSKQIIEIKVQCNMHTENVQVCMLSLMINDLYHLKKRYHLF